MKRIQRICLINAILLVAILTGMGFAQREEFVFYGDTISGELLQYRPAPETLVVIYAEGYEVTPHQPVPDFWQSIWDIDVYPYSIPRFYKEMSYGEHTILAHPCAHWTGTWYYTFKAQEPYHTPYHGQNAYWDDFCVHIVRDIADAEIDFSDYGESGQLIYVVVTALCTGGASGIYWPSGIGPIQTNDEWSPGNPVYVMIHYAYRCDDWAWHGHIAMNIHEYGHNWFPDTYGDHYNTGSLCGHYGYGFCQYHSWTDLIPSPLNAQWRSEVIDNDIQEPWMILTEITETQLNYPIMPMKETYNGEAVKVRPAQMPGIAQRDTQTFFITNHQNLDLTKLTFQILGF